MEERDSKQDDYYDPRSLLNPAERDCLQKIEEEEDLLERLHEQREVALERLWSTFQSAASSLAQLYKGKTCLILITYNFNCLKVGKFKV